MHSTILNNYGTKQKVSPAVCSKLLKNMLQCPSKPFVLSDLDLEVETAWIHEPVLVDINDNMEDEHDWNGTVDYYPSSDSEFEENDSDDEYGSEDSEFSELEGKDLKESLQKALEAELAFLTQPTSYEDIW